MNNYRHWQVPAKRLIALLPVIITFIIIIIIIIMIIKRGRQWKAKKE